MRPAATPSAKIHSCLLHSGAQAWLKTANQHSLHTCQRSTRTLTVRNVIHRHYHRCPEAHGRYTKSTAALPAAQEPAHIDLLGYPARAQNTMLHAAQEYVRRYDGMHTLYKTCAHTARERPAMLARARGARSELGHTRGKRVHACGTA